MAVSVPEPLPRAGVATDLTYLPGVSMLAYMQGSGRATHLSIINRRLRAVASLPFAPDTRLWMSAGNSIVLSEAGRLVLVHVKLHSISKRTLNIDGRVLAIRADGCVMALYWSKHVSEYGLCSAVHALRSVPMGISPAQAAYDAANRLYVIDSNGNAFTLKPNDKRLSRIEPSLVAVDDADDLISAFAVGGDDSLWYGNAWGLFVLSRSRVVRVSPIRPSMIVHFCAGTMLIGVLNAGTQGPEAITLATASIESGATTAYDPLQLSNKLLNVWSGITSDEQGNAWIAGDATSEVTKAHLAAC